MIALGGCKDSSQLEYGITTVWAVDDCEKVKQDDLEHWAKTSPRNTVWDGRTINIFGARNEIVAFQVIIESRNGGATDVNVFLDSLSCGSAVIKNTVQGSGPFNFVGKKIELFTESYVNVTERSDWWLASARPLSDALHTGWIPDALIPFEVKGKFTHGSGGAPFAIEGSKNQGVWIDVFIPNGVPAGVYGGTVRVIERDTTRFSIPLSLTVYDFDLPDVPHLHNFFFWGWPTISQRHGEADNSPAYWRLFHTYENVFHRHRMDLVDGTRTLDTFQVRLAGYYTGDYYTPAYGYEGPGTGVGNQTYSIGTYDQPTDGWRSGFFPDTPAAWQAAANRWEGWFREHAPGILRFKYMEDEPPYEHWPDVRTKAGWIKSSPGVGKDLDILVTTRMGEELYGYITIWLTGGQAGWPDKGGTTGYDIPVAEARRAAGEKVGIYNGQRPSYGDPTAIDDFAADARVNAWICWKYHVDLYFLWETAFYTNATGNPWAQPQVGSIIYTGEDTVWASDSRGIPGPIVSIRMKNMRRGFQDYEYLWLARASHIETAEIVWHVVPAAFNDYNGKTFTSQRDQPTWASRGYVFEQARRRLADQITHRTHNTTGREAN